MQLEAIIRYFTLFFGILWGISAKGQTPCFDADVRRGCAPLGITLTDCSGSAAILYDYGDGVLRTENTFTYTTPGLKTIKQIVQTPTGGQELVRQNYIEVFPAEAPDISVSSCSGNGVNVLVLDSFYEMYLVDFGDGTTQQVLRNQAISHTYPSGQAQATITVTGQYNNGGGTCGQVSRTVPLLQNIQPATLSRARITGAGSVELTLALPQNVPYQLQQSVNGGTFQAVETLAAGSTSATLTGLNLQDQSCFRIVAVNPCTGTDVLSNTICTVEATAGANTQENTLLWQPYPIAQAADFVAYTVFRDGVQVQRITNRNTNQWADTDVVCGQRYCYRIVTELAGGRSSESGESCVTATTTRAPEPPTQVTASVENGKITLFWQATAQPGTQFVVMRQTSTGGWEEAGLTSSRLFIEETVDAGTQTACYQIKTRNACGIESLPSATVCSVWLQVEPEGQDFRLLWTPPSSNPVGYSYEIEVYDAQGNLLERIGPIAAGTTTFLDQTSGNVEGTRTYQIRVVYAGSPPRFAFSNQVVAVGQAIVAIPDAFSPNGDGLNDTWYPRVTFVASMTMEVYNRWGEKIFAGDLSGEGWDGSVNGQPAQAGPYTFLVEATSADGKTVKKTGMLLLIR